MMRAKPVESYRQTNSLWREFFPVADVQKYLTNLRALTTLARHTQVSRATVGGMGLAWAAVVWWGLRVSDPVLESTV